MRKEEFMDGLKNALTGEVSQTVLMENLNYYEDYIIIEIRKGRKEEEVLEELGNPRLIAKTIIDMHSESNGVARSCYEEYEQEDLEREAKRNMVFITGWKAKFIFAVVVIGIICLFGIVLSFLLPLLSILIGTALVLAIVRRMMN